MDLVGVWQLKAAYFVAQESGECADLLGANLFGYGIFAANGRAMAIVTDGGRTLAALSSDMAALFKSMFAFTGSWWDRRRHVRDESRLRLGHKLGRDRTGPSDQ